MNENLNLVEILKNCPKGTKFYTPVWGEVSFRKLLEDKTYAISIDTHSGSTCLTKEGYYLPINDAECIIFPSKEQRDWSKFKPKKPKFDPKTLQPFDKILGRGDTKSSWLCHRHWKCAIFSHINNGATYPIQTVGDSYKYAVPYNEETKHLVGTTDEAPEFYRYWED